MNEDKNIDTSPEAENKSAESSGGDYRVRVGRFENIAAKILCVLAAVALWFYVVGTNTTIEEKVFENVAVAIRGTEALESELGLSVISGRDYVVNLTLQGARSDMDRIHSEDITAYVDVSDIKESGEHTLNVAVDVPGGVSVVSQSVSIIRLYVDKGASRIVPVKVETRYTMEAAYTMETPIPSFDTVIVTGPESELDKIGYAKVVLELGRVDRTMTSTGILELVDKEGVTLNNPYLKLQKSEVLVQIPVKTHKEVPLVLEYEHGFYNSSNVSVTVSPATIRIMGDPDDLAKISEIPLTIDEKTITGDTEMTMTIEVPKGAENISGKREANVTIKHKNTETREVAVTNFEILNPSDLKFSHDAEMSVTFRGTKTALALLNANNVTAQIDLGACPSTPGKHKVPVSITVTKALADSVYEIGEYTMDVTVE